MKQANCKMKATAEAVYYRTTVFFFPFLFWKQDKVSIQTRHRQIVTVVVGSRNLMGYFVKKTKAWKLLLHWYMSITKLRSRTCSEGSTDRGFRNNVVYLLLDYEELVYLVDIFHYYTAYLIIFCYKRCTSNSIPKSRLCSLVQHLLI